MTAVRAFAVTGGAALTMLLGRRVPAAGAILATWLAVSACQVAVAPPDARRSPAADKPAAPARASATPGVSATPGASVTGTPAAPGQATPTPAATLVGGGTPAPGAVAPRVLLKPAAKSAVLRGTVAIDASYLVAVGAGSVVANGGSRLAAAGKGLLLANNGSSLVSNNSGRVVANNAGNIISDKGSGIISDKGSGIISDKGSGYALVGLGPPPAAFAITPPRSFGLAQAADPVPEYGAQLPAAGMVVRVVSLADGKPVPVGVDAAGQPVTAVYTNLAGGYEVYVPAELTGTLRVIAEVGEAGEAQVADQRLSYALFVHPDREDAGTLDEDTAAVARYVRQGLSARFQNVLTAAADARAAGTVKDAELVQMFLPNADEYVPKELLAVLGGILGEVITAVQANPAITRADYPEVARKLADAVFALGPDPATIEVALTDYPPDEQALAKASPYGLGPAFRGMTGILRELRLKVVEAGRGKAASDVEAAFAAKPYLATANRLRPAGAAPYRVRKASDLADFIMAEYVPLVRGMAYDTNPSVTNGDIQDLSKVVFKDLGLPEGHVDVLYASGGAITLAMAPAIIDPVGKAKLIAVVKAHGQ